MSKLVPLFLIAFSLLFTKQAHSQEKIKIGVIAPLSGSISTVGETLKNSVMLADISLDNNDLVEFIFEDDSFSPKNSVTAARKLISQDKVSGIIIFGSSTSLAVAPIAETEKIPTIAMALSEKVALSREYTFRLFFIVDDLAELAAKEAVKLNYQSLAIVTTTQDGMLAMRDKFLTTNKIKLLLNEEVAPEETDFRSTASKIARLNPSAVFLALLPPQPSSFSKQLRQLGYKGELFSGPQIQSLSEVAASNGALQQTWFVTQNDHTAKEFYNNYKQKFGDVSHPDGIYGYEAARLFINGASNKDIFYYLSNLKEFHGIHGKYNYIGANTFASPVTVKRITKDGF